jgi:hypothetical protein
MGCLSSKQDICSYHESYLLPNFNYGLPCDIYLKCDNSRKVYYLIIFVESRVRQVEIPSQYFQKFKKHILSHGKLSMEIKEGTVLNISGLYFVNLYNELVF